MFIDIYEEENVAQMRHRSNTQNAFGLREHYQALTMAFQCSAPKIFVSVIPASLERKQLIPIHS